MKYSKTLNSLSAEGAFVWGDYANAQEKESGKPVLRLHIGQPDFLPHKLVRKAIAEAYLDGKTGYGPILGLDILREAVATEIQTYLKKAKITKDNVAITSGGGKGAIGVVFRSLLDRGDTILVPCFNYPGHFSGFSDAGAKWVPYKLLPEKNFDIDLVDFEKQLKKSKASVVVLLSPSNPTGAVIPYKSLKIFAQLANKYNVTVVTDEIYRGHVFEGEFLSIMDFPGMQDRTVIIDAPGKRNCVTGIRIGYIIGPVEYIDGPVRKLNNVRFSCAQTPEQIGLAQSINNKEVLSYITNMKDEFKKRRDFVVKELNMMPNVTCPKPGGAFYLFPDISKTGYTGVEFAKKFLKEKNVCVLPGESFGGGMIDPQTKKPYGTYCVRLSIASSMETLKEALKRMKEFLSE